MHLDTGPDGIKRWLLEFGASVTPEGKVEATKHVLGVLDPGLATAEFALITDFQALPADVEEALATLRSTALPRKGLLGRWKEPSFTGVVVHRGPHWPAVTCFAPYSIDAELFTGENAPIISISDSSDAVSFVADEVTAARLRTLVAVDVLIRAYSD